MTELKIIPIAALEHTVSTEKPDYVISITDPDGGCERHAKSILDNSGVPYFWLGFHDIDRVMDRFIAPSSSVFEDLFADMEKRFKDAPPKSIVVHCTAGISRSPSVGILALAKLSEMRGEDTPADGIDIVKSVFQKNPHITPNPRIMSIGRSIFRRMGNEMRSEAKKQEELASNGPAHPDLIW